MAITVTAAAAQSMGAALATAIGSGGLIRIYSGSKPATPETAASGTLLATVTVTGSFTSTGGVLTAADPAQVTPTANGTAGYFRLLTSGATAILDGTVGTSGADMNLSSTTISTASPLDLGVPTITVPVA
jgi:hypothetical protein